MGFSWKDKDGIKKYLYKLGGLFVAILVVALVIKIIGHILGIISHTPNLNTAIAVAATIIVLVLFCCVCKKDKNTFCGHDNPLEPSSSNQPRDSKPQPDQSEK